jgi:hypothetical protein
MAVPIWAGPWCALVWRSRAPLGRRGGRLVVSIARRRVAHGRGPPAPQTRAGLRSIVRGLKPRLGSLDRAAPTGRTIEALSNSDDGTDPSVADLGSRLDAEVGGSAVPTTQAAGRHCSAARRAGPKEREPGVGADGADRVQAYAYALNTLQPLHGNPLTCAGHLDRLRHRGRISLAMRRTIDSTWRRSAVIASSSSRLTVSRVRRCSPSKRTDTRRLTGSKAYTRPTVGRLPDARRRVIEFDDTTGLHQGWWRTTGSLQERDGRG